MVGPAGFHQDFKSFILDNTKWPHTLSNPLHNLNTIGFMSLSVGKSYEAKFVPSFLVRVISM